MESLKRALVPIAAALATGCRGGRSGGLGNGPPSFSPERPFDQHTVNTLITGGDVRIYAFEDGTRGDVLSSGTSADGGLYQIDMQTRSQPVLVEISGGAYTEESSGRVSLRPITS